MDRGCGATALSTKQRAYTKGQKRRRPARPAPVEAPMLQEVIRPQIVVSRAVIEPENLRWFVLRCEPQKEEIVVRVFDRTGIPAAIPTIQRERIRRGKLLKWRQPIAPGYVLVGFPGSGPIPWQEAVLQYRIVYGTINDDRGMPVQAPWHAVYDSGGKIKRGGVEALLPDLEAIRIGASKFMRVWQQFSKDETVRVENGPFTGFEGTVRAVNGADANVLLEVFGRKTSVVLPVGDVARAA